MPRDIPVTFSDGSTHLYQGAPDDITPQLATQRANKDFPNLTVTHLDGLVLAPDGTILAIQNGLRPTRVLRISLDDVAETVTEVRVLESGHLTMAAPSLGCIGPEGALHFIGNAGWTRFEGTDGRPSQPRSIPIFRTELPRAR